MLKGQSPFAADRQHLHHRLQNMGHSHRQTVLLMYLWAALFTGAVVGLSVIRVPLVWLALVTVAAVIGLVLATMPSLRPWRSTGKRAAGSRSRHRAGAAPVRSIETMTPAAGQAAAALGPAQNAMPLLSAPPEAEQPRYNGQHNGQPSQNGHGPYEGERPYDGQHPYDGQRPGDGQAAYGQPGPNGHASNNGQAMYNGQPTYNGRHAPGAGPLPSRRARNAGATRP
jgi:hypothetical protein